MIKKIALAIAATIVVAVLAIVGIAATKPDTMVIERSTTINATAETILPLIENFHNWGQWSPWEKLDPDMKRTYSGKESGFGAVYEWDGNDEVGAGRMEITECSPAKVSIKLDFLKPFEGHDRTEIFPIKSGDATKVVWRMTGENNMMCKIMQVFMDMDKMLGKDFETGLANMKQVAESGGGEKAAGEKAEGDKAEEEKTE